MSISKNIKRLKRYVAVFAAYLGLSQNILNAQATDFIRARAFEIKNLPDSALIYYSKLLAIKESDTKILLARGRVYFVKKDFDNAILDFKKANQLSNDIASFQLAQCYAVLNDLPMTIEFLKKHLSSKYKQPQVNIRLNSAFLKFESNADWKKLWVNDWYNKSDNQVGEARFMFNNKDWMGVINYVSGVLKENSKRHELLYFRAKAYFAMENFTTSLNDYNSAIEVFKNNSNYYEGRAEVYRKLGKVKEAYKDYSTAINLEPDNFNYYLQRAELSLALNNIENSKEDIDLYLSLFSSDYKARFLAGKIAFASGNYLTALSYYNSLINEYPQRSTLYFERAETFNKATMYPNALKDYNICLNLEPSNIPALRKLGQLQYSLNNLKEACINWKKAMNAGDFESNNLYLDNCR